jgi:hypothetical protein
MSDHSANSYDLLQAQQILHILTQRPGNVAKERPAPISTPNYSNLSISGLPEGSRRDKPTDGIELNPSDEKPDQGSQTFDSWESCIAWCMSLTRAEAAFVADSQGFIIACRGRIPSHGFEGAGAEMICSIEQLERIAPDAGKLSCIDMEFDKKRLIGFVALSEGTNFYVVGLVSPEPLNISVKQKITQQIILNLPNLD